MALDEARKNDTVIEVEGIPFFIDRFTQRYIADEVSLDYDPARGFTLYSDEEIISYGLVVYTRMEDIPRGRSC